MVNTGSTKETRGSGGREGDGEERSGGGKNYGYSIERALTIHLSLSLSSEAGSACELSHFLGQYTELSSAGNLFVHISR
jgi:hypothetical protein